MLPPRTSEWPICIKPCGEQSQRSGSRAPLRADVALAGYLETQRAHRATQTELGFKMTRETIRVLATIVAQTWRFRPRKPATGAKPAL